MKIVEPFDVVLRLIMKFSVKNHWKFRLLLNFYYIIARLKHYATDKNIKDSRTGGSKLYHIKLSERDLIMWWDMQQTQIIPHIRAISYGLTFSSKSWSHDKPKFYHIFNLLETQIILHFPTTMIWLVRDSFSMIHFNNSWLIFLTRYSWLVVLNNNLIGIPAPLPIAILREKRQNHEWFETSQKYESWIDDNEKNKWIIENKSRTSQIIVVRKCSITWVSSKFKM